MLPYDLFLSILVVLAASQDADSRPSSSYAIDLSICSPGSYNSSMIEQCAPLCRPVMDAQTTCMGQPECTCKKALPESVQACLQCHLEAGPDVYDREAVLVASSKLSEYALVCDSILQSRSVPTNISSLLSPPTELSAIRIRREPRQDCVYGMPEIIFPQPVSLLRNSGRSPWVLFAFVAVIFLFIIQRTWKRSSS